MESREAGASSRWKDMYVDGDDEGVQEGDMLGNHREPAASAAPKICDRDQKVQNAVPFDLMKTLAAARRPHYVCVWCREGGSGETKQGSDGEKKKAYCGLVLSCSTCRDSNPHARMW